MGAIRAEQVRIAAGRKSQPGSRRQSRGIVADAIFEGERIVYEVEVPALGGAVMRVFDHDAENHQQFSPGDEVSLGWNSRDMHFFKKVNLRSSTRGERTMHMRNSVRANRSAHAAQFLWRRRPAPQRACPPSVSAAPSRRSRKSRPKSSCVPGAEAGWTASRPACLTASPRQPVSLSVTT